MVARQSRRLIGTLVFLAVALALVVAAPGCAAQDRPRNVIFMIGDGMGFEHVRAASLYEYGREGALAFEKYHRSEVTTDSIGPNGKMVVTDSAAAATALATGHKVRNGVLSQDEAGEPYVTILEELKAQGKATGLVTTVYLTHATPAGYGAHAPSRKALGNIAGDLLRDSRPNVMLGAHAEGGKG